MDQNELKNKIEFHFRELGDWERNLRVQDLLDLINQHVKEVIGEDENFYENERKAKKFDWRVERETGANETKAEQRKRAGL